MGSPDLCFLAFPVLVVDQKYQLAIAAEDLETLELNPEQQPALGAEVAVFALVCLHDEQLPTANLMAPIVLNLKTQRGLQAIRRDTEYSHAVPIAAAHRAPNGAQPSC